MIKLEKINNEQLKKCLENLAQNASKGYYAHILAATIEYKKDLPANIDVDQQLEEGLDSFAKNNAWSNYIKLLSQIVDLKKNTPNNVDQQLEEGLNYHIKKKKVFEYAYFLLMMTAIKRANGQHLKDGLENLEKNRSWGNYAKLLLEAIKEGEVSGEELEEYLDKLYQSKWYDSYVELLIKIIKLNKNLPVNIYQQLEKGLDDVADSGWYWYRYVEFLLELTELGIDLPVNTNQQLVRGLRESIKKENWSEYVIAFIKNKKTNKNVRFLIFKEFLFIILNNKKSIL